jgi:hypothetical protein
MRTPPTATVILCCMLATITVTAAQGRFRARDAGRFPVSDESTTRRTLRFAAGAVDRVLDVRLLSGSMTVLGTSGADVEIELRRRVRLKTEADRPAAEQGVTVDFTDNASRIGFLVRDDQQRLCGEQSNGRTDDWRARRYDVAFDATIRVPRDARLRLCLINGGELRVAQTSGDFDISHINGSIVMEDVRGSGRAETINGDLRATFAAPPRTDSTFTTLNGDVDLTFPRDLGADFRLKTRTGALFTDFDTVMPARRAPIVAEERNGMRVYQASYTTVRVGSGGPEVTVETFNGDVRLRRASR